MCQILIIPPEEELLEGTPFDLEGGGEFVNPQGELSPLIEPQDQHPSYPEPYPQAEAS